MNHLDIVKRLHQKCRVSGVGPVSVSPTQGADINRLIAWASEAWMDIQNDQQDWSWMRRSASWQTAEGQAMYTIDQTGVSDLGNWAMDTFRVHQTAPGLPTENYLTHVDYDYWRDVYQFASQRTTKTIPIHVAKMPSNGIALGPAPTAGLTVSGDYFAVATELEAGKNDAVPGLPAQFHMAIVYRAMMLYGMSEAAAEVLGEGEAEFNRMMARIRRHELPELALGGPLA